MEKSNWIEKHSNTRVFRIHEQIIADYNNCFLKTKPLIDQMIKTN